MKKLLAFLCALTLMLSLGVTAFADSISGETSGYTEILTEVPSCTWTLKIPADTSIAFGEPEKELGDVEITNIQNQKGNKHIRAYLSTSCLFCLTSDINTTFPYDIQVYLNTTELVPKKVFTLRNEGYVSELVEVSTAVAGDTTLSSTLTILVDSSAWNSAPEGKYAGYLTFTSSLED